MKNMLIVKVAIAKATRGYDREYDYLVPASFVGRAKTGCGALVPFGAKNTVRRAMILSVYSKTTDTDNKTMQSSDGNGVDRTVGCGDPGFDGGAGVNNSPAGALKQLADVLDGEPSLTPKDIELAARMREKYNCTWFEAFSCMLPVGWGQKKGASRAAQGTSALHENAAPAGKFPDTQRIRFELTAEQESALCGLSQMLDRREFSEALLFGVTGSGKTEIYMRLISRVIARGRQAIVLVPEISLTPQMMQRFTDFFGDCVAIFHSRLTKSERVKQWRRVRDGDAQIALGARSAVFAPFSNLGAIVIDEEHEPSYKSEMTPRYHTCEIAKMRCESHCALLAFGSATPSVELFYRASRGECKLFVLRERTNRKPLPAVHIVDMRDELKIGNRGIFSRKLIRALSDELSDNKQAILFLNRRGYSSFLLCRSCGYIVTCRDCSVSFTYHKESDRLVCHYCGLTAPVPLRCPVCKGTEIGGFGAGTEKVEREALRLFPKSRVLRMDRDTASGKDAYSKILNAFRDGKADILIGTQMIAKGHDFPNVTLVGVLAADAILNFTDFRATERTFQLLTQVAGRSGRGEAAGRVVIQTYNPDHFSVATAKEHDYDSFYKQEMIARRELLYPPFMNIGVFLLTGRDDARVHDSAARLKQALAAEDAGALAVIGPARPAHAKLKERYRWRVVIKHMSVETMEAAARRASEFFYRENKPAGVDLTFDINPFSML